MLHKKAKRKTRRGNPAGRGSDRLQIFLCQKCAHQLKAGRGIVERDAQRVFQNVNAVVDRIAMAEGVCRDRLYTAAVEQIEIQCAAEIAVVLFVVVMDSSSVRGR